MLQPADAEVQPKESTRRLLYASLVVVVGVLSVQLAQPGALGRLPIQNLLKNGLHVGRAANAAFFFWIGLAWYFKPFAGIITDAFPLFGSRRKSYMLMGATLATLGWIALYFTPHQYYKLLFVCVLINACIVLASTSVGGYMVEAAQASGGSGRFTSIFNFINYFSVLVSGPIGGFLASIAFGWTTLCSAAVMFLLVPGAMFFLYERHRKMDSRELLTNAGKQLANIASARTMWAAAGFMALFYCAPGLSTATFYRQQNLLHMNTQGQGDLLFLSGLFGMAAAVLYGMYACRRFSLRTLLLVCVAFGAAANLGYLFYSSVGHARIIESFNGFGFTLAELAMMDLAIRSTPKESEGMGFSLMMSVRNLSLFGSDWFGSKMMDTYHLHYNTLVLANTATTLLVLPFVFLLPAAIVRAKSSSAG